MTTALHTRWDWLPPWPETPSTPRHTGASALAEEWERNFAPPPWSEADLEAICRFLARCIPEIREVFSSSDLKSRLMRRRLLAVDTALKPFRESYRSGDLAKASSNKERRLADLAVFLIHDLLASEEEKASFQGVIHKTYLLQLEVDEASSMSSTVRRLRYGATLCDQAAPRFTAGAARELRRRAHELRARAETRHGFALFGRRVDPGLIAPHFEEAAVEIAAAELLAPRRHKRDAAYVSFWCAGLKCRMLERAGDHEQARVQWRAVMDAAGSFNDERALFKRPGVWSSMADVAREVKILDAMAALSTGIHGVQSASKLIDEWLSAVEEDFAVQPRRKVRGRIRALALRGLADYVRGRRNLAPLHQALGIVESPGFIDVSGLALLTSVYRTVTEERAPDAAIAAATGLLAPNDLVPRKDSDPFRFLPPAYRQLHASSASACAPLLTRWYLRVVTDYLYSVYEDRFTESAIRVEIPPPPDLAHADLPFLLTVQQALLTAFHWDGAPGAALEDLVMFTESALNAGSDAQLLGNLLGTMRRTQRALFPTPGLLVGELPHNRTKIITYIDIPREVSVLPPHDAFPEGRFFYLKPAQKLNETIERRRGRGVHVYEARAFGIPTPVVLLCEGDTDKAALEAVLDALDPTWTLLDLRVEHDGGADGLAAAATRMLRSGDAFVAVVDGDQAVRGDGAWPEILGDHRTFVLHRDIERVSYPALVLALEIRFRVRASITELRRLDMKARQHDSHFVDELDAYFKCGPIKGGAFGRTLGESFVKVGVPEAIERACSTALDLANGVSAERINGSHDGSTGARDRETDASRSRATSS